MMIDGSEDSGLRVTEPASLVGLFVSKQAGLVINPAFPANLFLKPPCFMPAVRDLPPEAMHRIVLIDAAEFISAVAHRASLEGEAPPR
jgi:hypothetical protein